MNDSKRQEKTYKEITVHPLTIKYEIGASTGRIIQLDFLHDEIDPGNLRDIISELSDLCMIFEANAEKEREQCVGYTDEEIKGAVTF